MSNMAIRVETLGKQYTIGGAIDKTKTFRESLVDAVASPYRRLRKVMSGGAATSARTDETFWALQGIDFTIEQGEVVGIIGHNGAGKSTLLKILSRITEPTVGKATLYGRVGALLEVGTGFHPELTGRENVYMNAAILGMSRKEINRKFDEIVDFAEVEQFIETPVKHYSSGMTLRLGFAVAAHLEPEILIVDEVLAVGDASFQRKCLVKMNDVAGEGRTVLFVSHNMAAVQNLCSRAIWLTQGSVYKDGEVGEVIADYTNAVSDVIEEIVWDNPADAPGNDQIRVHRIRIRNADDPREGITVSSPVELYFEYWNQSPGLHLNLSIHLFNNQEVMVLNTFPTYGTVASTSRWRWGCTAAAA